MAENPHSQPEPDAAELTLGGGNVRGEVAGCPTGLPDLEQATQTRRPGGGGAPGTGDEEEGRREGVVTDPDRRPEEEE